MSVIRLTSTLNRPAVGAGRFLHGLLPYRITGGACRTLRLLALASSYSPTHWAACS